MIKFNNFSKLKSFMSDFMFGAITSVFVWISVVGMDCVINIIIVIVSHEDESWKCWTSCRVRAHTYINIFCSMYELCRTNWRTYSLKVAFVLSVRAHILIVQSQRISLFPFCFFFSSERESYEFIHSRDKLTTPGSRDCFWHLKS